MFHDNTGKIIIVRNIVFKNFFKGQFILTPDPHLIRPCLIISELEDKRYILPISSSVNNEKFEENSFKINNDDMALSTLTSESCYIKLDQIVPIEPYYRKPVDELDEMKYYKCLLKLKNFYDHLNYESVEYESVKQDVNKQLKKLKPRCKLSI